MDSARFNTGHEVFVLFKLRTGELDIGSTKQIVDKFTKEPIPNILKHLQNYKDNFKEIKLM